MNVKSSEDSFLTYLITCLVDLQQTLDAAGAWYGRFPLQPDVANALIMAMWNFGVRSALLFVICCLTICSMLGVKKSTC